MKLYTVKRIFPLLLCMLIFNSCDDEKMQWGKIGGEITAEEIPLELTEKIERYDFVKTYAAQYTPQMCIGIGLSANLYNTDEEYKQVCDDNFQLFTMGNAMKHGTVVRDNGELNFTTIDKFFNIIPEDKQIYGHNFIWHTQQNQNYLKKLVVEALGNEGEDPNPPTPSEDNMIVNGNFETGNTNGWSGWGNSSSNKLTQDGSYGNILTLTNPTDGSTSHSAQIAYKISGTFEMGATYTATFEAKAQQNGKIQIALQKDSEKDNYPGEGYKDYDITTQWVSYTYTHTIKTVADMDRFMINFGLTANTYYIDNISLVKNSSSGESPEPDPEPDPDPILPGVGNLLNESFENGNNGWDINPGKASDGYSLESVEQADSPDGNKVLKIYQNGLLQIKTPEIPVGKEVVVSFYIKGEQEANVSIAFLNGVIENQYAQITGTNIIKSKIAVTTAWQQVTFKLQDSKGTMFKDGVKQWTYILDFGRIKGNTYYIDNVQITDPSVTATYTTQLKYTQNATPRAISSSLRNNEKIQTALYGAMENWIKEMIKHCGKRVTAWDVLNEPINDDLGLRGVDNKYASGDSEPTGSTASDLNLNWISSAGNQHFYWGYFLGKEYAVKAFQYARKYANEQQTDAKLYINDYNLESNPNKLKELIEYVKYIDEQNGSPIVDGIGTQMHVNVDLKKSQVDAMFKTMASTGKLIRITELDVAVKTTTPSIEQQQSQADTYLMIVESYKENVPEVQQAGITIWNLTDSKKEHEYWLNGDAPNLFNADYSRKIAYKAFCDGLAGKDISEDWEKPMNK